MHGTCTQFAIPAGDASCSELNPVGDGGRWQRPLFDGSIFPPDAFARIFRPSRSVTTSGTARTKRWVLRFDRRTPPFLEPLMGWTGGDDTLTQVELTFPSREAAVAYAKRHGLAYQVAGDGYARHDLADSRWQRGGLQLQHSGDDVRGRSPALMPRTERRRAA
jgi:hypothetical protein